MFWLNILLRNREINQMCECFLLQVQHTVFVQLDHSSICLWLNKKGIFFLKNLSFFQSSWYSSWHFGFRKLTGPGLGPISLRGWPGALRTFRVISIATNPPKVSPTSLAYCLPAPWKGCTPVGTSSVLSSHSVISLCSTLFFFAIPRLGGSESEAIEPAYAFTLQDVEVLLKYKTQDHLVCNKGFKGICQGYRKNKLCLS